MESLETNRKKKKKKNQLFTHVNNMYTFVQAKKGGRRRERADRYTRLVKIHLVSVCKPARGYCYVDIRGRIYIWIDTVDDFGYRNDTDTFSFVSRLE